MLTADAADSMAVELLIAVNPDEDSRLPYLLRVPLAGGDLVFRTRDLAAHQGALLLPGPARRVARRCGDRRTGRAALVSAARCSDRCDPRPRPRKTGPSWYSPPPAAATRCSGRVRGPANRPAPGADPDRTRRRHSRPADRDRLPRAVPYWFATQQVSTVKRALPCGDYALVLDGVLVASVERKSLVDLVASLTGKLRYQVAELATLPRPRSWSRTATHSCSNSTTSDRP